MQISDYQMQIMQFATEPLHENDKRRFLDAVTAELRQHSEISDVLVARTCRAIQLKYMRPDHVVLPGK
jgi:hypothetical protein